MLQTQQLPKSIFNTIFRQKKLKTGSNNMDVKSTSLSPAFYLSHLYHKHVPFT